MQLLVIEDSTELRSPLVNGLRRSGYTVDEASDGKTGLWMAESGRYDLLILDIMLPGLNGLKVLARLREAGRKTRVLLLTAKDALEDRVTGLRGGADDYLVKPFSFDELLARVEALLRRGSNIASTEIRIGDLLIDTAGKIAKLGSEKIQLTPREYAILELLAKQRGQVVGRAEIEEQIYDSGMELMSNVVDSAVCSLRRKVDEPNRPSLIQTRRGHGYIIPSEDR